MSALDELDRHLIAELRVDGRASASSLARRLGISRATVNNRLDRLMRERVVLGFTVRIRDEVQDDGVRAISMIEVHGRSNSDVISRLRGMPEIQGLHTTNGGWDMVAELRVRSLGEFDALLGRIRSIEGVLNSETSILLSSILR